MSSSNSLVKGLDFSLLRSSTEEQQAPVVKDDRGHKGQSRKDTEGCTKSVRDRKITINCMETLKTHSRRAWKLKLSPFTVPAVCPLRKYWVSLPLRKLRLKR